MRVDAYEFGRIVVDGREERRDLIITSRGIHPNWWRREGHALVLEDLGPALEARPEVLIIGTGADGRMRPAPGLAGELARRGIETEIHPTLDAVRRFNQLLGVRDVAAALHLTC